jgi:hypothetical protein
MFTFHEHLDSSFEFPVFVIFILFCLRLVSCILNVANVSGCPFTIVADLVFPNVYLNSDSEQQ